MKVILTRSDFSNNKITKIARSLSKIIPSDRNMQHSKVLLLVANILGYSSYHHAKTASEHLAGIEDMKMFGSGRIFDTHYSPSTDVIKKQFIKVVAKYLNADDDINVLFNSIPFKALDFFRDDQPDINLTKKILNSISDHYFNNLRQISLEGFSLENSYFSPSFRQEAFHILETLDDSYISEVLNHESIEDFFASNIKQTYNDESGEVTERGSFQDLIILPAHNYMVRFAIGCALLKDKVSSKQFQNISKNLFREFMDKFGQEKTISLFMTHRNPSGFYGEYSGNGYGCRWKRLSSETVSPATKFSTCKIKVEECMFNSSLDGLYWKLEKFNDNGKLECVVSGGIYLPERVEDHSSVCFFDFPSDENSDLSRERALTSRMTGGDLTINDKKNNVKTHIGKLSKALNKGNIATISVVEKKHKSRSGLGSQCLKEAISIISHNYDVASFFLYAAPMQYIDWKPGDDFMPISTRKKRDVVKLCSHLKATLPKGLSVEIVTPRI